MGLHKELGFEDEEFVVGESEFLYEEFAVEVFGINEIEADNMTSACWGHIDNTPKGAGQRLLYLLKHGEVIEPFIESIDKYKDLKLEDFIDDWKSELKESIQ